MADPPMTVATHIHEPADHGRLALPRPLLALNLGITRIEVAEPLVDDGQLSA
ncbi:hypothetical protein [Cereibacter sphaeroides]|uniref:hypothetical protein n=1 Tax=Cereibacter sphaeroides TaxID=1063 RepID=UPI001F306EAD|nr:hypothetical protein [Cereibacter sphaeroides]